MNFLKNIKLISISALLVCIVGMGCKKSFLDEYNPTNQTTDNYYVDKKGFESLVSSCYPLLRDITQQRVLAFRGTDLFTSNGSAGTSEFSAGGWGALYYHQPANGSAYDVYDVRFNSSMSELQALWDLLYREINRCNTVVGRAPAIPDMTDSLKSIRVGEALFLRSLCLFWAVQHWGDVPMPLTETTAASQVVTKAVSKDIYTQLITDLTKCVRVLPVTQTDVGRATQGAAKFLLARVYLTRGWNFNNELGGSPADFTSSLQLCDQLISSGIYPLEANWNNLWPIHNHNPNVETATQASSVASCNASKEVIFAVQYSNPSAYSGDLSVGTTTSSTGTLLVGIGTILIGNNMHEMFSGAQSAVAQQTRTALYNRFNPTQICTWAAYRLFDPTKDVRYEGTFNSVTYATVNGGSVSLATNNPNPQNITLTYNISDTVGVCRPWNNPVVTPSGFGVNIPGGTKKYSVVNTEQYIGLGYVGANQIVDNLFWGPPMFWKFWQPKLSSYGDGFSTFNDPLFRSAEVYLMAAEAIVKGGTGSQLGTADIYYNKVLDRA